ncbi:natural resistance-associated macrophage protein-domain-containing protein [Chiua virens]|nr:natural resistance-associated macrophage protein-domain-containing protein [Chiua virens]
MLFVILLSGIMAVLFQVCNIPHVSSPPISLPQVLATRLGCVTGLDLAAHCRILLHDHPKYPRLARFLLLYPLYILSELAIIATDLAELLGSAIAFTLFIPELPMWAGVLLTALDVFVFLLIADNSQVGRPVRLVETAILLLACSHSHLCTLTHSLQVAAVFISFIVLVIKVDPQWPQAFLGFVPSQDLFETQPNAVYTAIGIIGATIMPHGLFLGSHLATQDRLSSSNSALPLPAAPQRSSLWRSLFSISNTSHDDLTDKFTRHGLRSNNSLSFIRAHLAHAVVDIVLSLLVVAVPINCAILILSAAVSHPDSTTSSVGIPQMYHLILNNLGKGAAFLFAIALVFSGEVASVTATFAGQIVSEGFILWKFSPFLRRLTTRLLGLIPSMIVAMIFGRTGLNTLLVASQVALSVVLPFVLFPLIYLTSSKTVMSVKGAKGAVRTNAPSDEMLKTPLTGVVCQEPPSTTPSECSDVMLENVKTTTVAASSNVQPHGDTIDFSNSCIVATVAYAIWLLITVANVYGIVRVEFTWLSIFIHY